jgi:hypothetical protein
LAFAARRVATKPIISGLSLDRSYRSDRTYRTYLLRLVKRLTARLAFFFGILVRNLFILFTRLDLVNSLRLGTNTDLSSEWIVQGTEQENE